MQCASFPLVTMQPAAAVRQARTFVSTPAPMPQIFLPTCPHYRRRDTVRTGSASQSTCNCAYCFKGITQRRRGFVPVYWNRASCQQALVALNQHHPGTYNRRRRNNSAPTIPSPPHQWPDKGSEEFMVMVQVPEAASTMLQQLWVMQSSQPQVIPCPVSPTSSAGNPSHLRPAFPQHRPPQSRQMLEGCWGRKCNFTFFLCAFAHVTKSQCGASSGMREKHQHA